MFERRRFILTTILTVALAGCGGRNRAEPGIIPDEPTTLKVENDQFNDMHIYVYRGSQRIRLGTATGKSSTTFKIPKYIVSGVTTLQFEAVPIGGNGATRSETITVNPGEDLVLHILPI